MYIGMKVYFYCEIILKCHGLIAFILLGTLARKHVSTLGALAHEHDFITEDTQISRLSAVYYEMQITNLKQLLNKI